jgi:hypothetical protein
MWYILLYIKNTSQISKVKRKSRINIQAYISFVTTKLMIGSAYSVCNGPIINDQEYHNYKNGYALITLTVTHILGYSLIMGAVSR